MRIFWLQQKPCEKNQNEYNNCLSGRGAVRLACLHGVQEVEGSNPFAPTEKTLGEPPGSFCFMFTGTIMDVVMGRSSLAQAFVVKKNNFAGYFAPTKNEPAGY